MNLSQISRRRFVQGAAVLGTTALLGSRLPAQAPKSGALTARQLVDLMKPKMVANWNEDSYRDTFKCGNPDTVIKGVASTFMSTLDVIKRANQAGLNFVITHEPTFWSDPDTITDHVFDDPLYQHKKDYIEKNNMVVWRSHDHWHLFRPEPMSVGFAKTLGWDKYLTEPGARTFRMPPTSVRDLAKQVAAKLESRSIRIVGDPNLMVTKLGRGGHGLAQNATALAADVDAIVTSEAREIDSIEYVRDLVVSGAKKAMILISHQTGEEAGMTEFVPWLQALIPDIKVQNIKTHDQLWIA
jgi:putative NIF3 family GTP cyclohydrolase 1 type 2